MINLFIKNTYRLFQNRLKLIFIRCRGCAYKRRTISQAIRFGGRGENSLPPTLISPVSTPRSHSLLGGRSAGTQPSLEVYFEPWFLCPLDKHSNHSTNRSIISNSNIAKKNSQRTLRVGKSYVKHKISLPSSCVFLLNITQKKQQASYFGP